VNGRPSKLECVLRPQFSLTLKISTETITNDPVSQVLDRSGTAHIARLSASDTEATQLPGRDEQDYEFIDSLVNQAASDIGSTLKREHGLAFIAITGILLAIIRLTLPASQADVIIAVKTGYIAAVIQGTLKFLAQVDKIRGV
jgi:hypothetical protein